MWRALGRATASASEVTCYMDPLVSCNSSNESSNCNNSSHSNDSSNSTNTLVVILVIVVIVVTGSGFLVLHEQTVSRRSTLKF